MSWAFRPRLIPTLAAAVAIAVMLKLGFWQYGKAQAKAALQHTYDARAGEVAGALPDQVENVEAWRYRKIEADGHYRADFQLLLDNQVEGEQAGYHVLTLFQPDSGGMVLVNRGWIPVGDRSRLPEVAIPAGTVRVSGFSWLPPSKYFELAAPEAASWEPVWQNLDLARYARVTAQPVLPFVIRLDAKATDGFVRNWTPPSDRMEKHLGYALQWWGFAATVFAIWIYVNVKRENKHDGSAA